MDFEKFKENIKFAKKKVLTLFIFGAQNGGIGKKTKRNDNRIWQTAQELIKSL